MKVITILVMSFFPSYKALSESLVSLKNIKYDNETNRSIVTFSNGTTLADFDDHELLDFVAQFQVQGSKHKPFNVFLLRSEQDASDTGPSLKIVVLENNERLTMAYPGKHFEDPDTGEGPVVGVDKVFYGRCLSKDYQVVNFYKHRPEGSKTGWIYSVEQAEFKDGKPSLEKKDVSFEEFKTAQMKASKKCKEIL